MFQTTVAIITEWIILRVTVRHPRPDPGESHAKAECSNMGSCNRATGTCNCETGFEGIACERYAAR